MTTGTASLGFRFSCAATRSGRLIPANPAKGTEAPMASKLSLAAKKAEWGWSPGFVNGLLHQVISELGSKLLDVLHGRFNNQ